MKFKKWFETFIAQKDLPYMVWEIEANGITHTIDSETVIETIKACPKEEQDQIKNTLVMIDFSNGDVNHFFKHLATAIANNY